MTQVVDASFIKNTLLSENLAWEVNPDKFLWLRASYNDICLNLKINPKFPDGPAYFFQLSNGEELGLDDFPSNWSRAPLQWSDKAKRDAGY